MRRNALALALVLTLGIAVPLQAQTPAPAPSTLQEAIPVIDAAFDRWQAGAHAPGLVYGVVQDGRIIHLRTTGVRTVDGADVAPDTLFRIASMSKAFTALAILKLRDEGRLSLDDLAETHVPEMANWTGPTADSPRIRVRDLLNTPAASSPTIPGAIASRS